MQKENSRKDKEGLIVMTMREKGCLALKSVLVVCLFNYFFYKELWAVPVLIPVGGFYYFLERKRLLQEKREEVKEQFKELMLLASTGQKAGYSTENAFLSGYGDMKRLYGGQSTICRMLQRLKTGMENHTDFGKMWRQMGQDVDIPEIEEFARVYEVAYKSSGNMSGVMEKTAEIIIQKLETKKEIRVLLSARVLEQKIMNAMPFLIMFYINITSPGYFAGMYHTLWGAVIMSVFLCGYLAAYVLSYKIVSIEL